MSDGGAIDAGYTMTYDAARARVAEHLAEMGRRYGKVFAILEGATRVEDFGWVFFYNAQKYIETGDARWAVGGNSPIIVDRETGELHVTGTAHPVEHCIANHRARRGRQRCDQPFGRVASSA